MISMNFHQYEEVINVCIHDIKSTLSALALNAKVFSPIHHYNSTAGLTYKCFILYEKSSVLPLHLWFDFQIDPIALEANTKLDFSKSELFSPVVLPPPPLAPRLYQSAPVPARGAGL